MIKRTKHFCYLFGIILAALAFNSCNDSDDYSGIPSEITEFLVHYYPNTAVESFSHSGTVYHVILKNGPGFTFNYDCEWTDMEGYGMPFPQVIMFDELPDALYRYLEETENTGSVFAVSRDASHYTVDLLNSTLTYSTDSGKITETFPAEGEQS